MFSFVKTQTQKQHNSSFKLTLNKLFSSGKKYYGRDTDIFTKCRELSGNQSTKLCFTHFPIFSFKL